MHKLNPKFAIAFLRRSGVKNRFLITGSTETGFEKSNYNNKALCILRMACFWLNIQVWLDGVIIGGSWDNIMGMFCSKLTNESDNKDQSDSDFSHFLFLRAIFF
jgi:hypothetical protein